MRPHLFFVLLAAGMAPSPAILAQAAADAAVPHAAAATEPLYATVNGKPISLREFQSAYANHVRNQFYHREGIADERLQAARKEVGDRMIERILLVEEADRRKVAPDEAKVAEIIAGYDRRYANSPMWQQNREQMLKGLRERLAEDTRLERLERSVRDIATPPEAEVRKFYESKPELFTEPEKLRLHTILLRVDPSAAGSVWDATRAEATTLAEQLRAGADFGELARKRSQDKSAENGGDMGYLHLGMVPEALQVRLDKLDLGAISDPIDVLEGVGIFRLDERVASRHRSYDEVAERARDLLLRDLQQKAWTDFVAALRSQADVRINEPQATAAAR